MAVDAAAFQRQPMGAQIAFFHDMDLCSGPGGGHDGGAVMGAAIAKEDQIGDGPVVQAAGDVAGPMEGRAAPCLDHPRAGSRDCFRDGGPVMRIAPVQIDAQHQVPPRCQRRAQQAKEGAGRPLQEEKAALTRRMGAAGKRGRFWHGRALCGERRDLGGDGGGSGQAKGV